MVSLLAGIFCIGVALIPDPTPYFGESLFKVKIMPYWVMDVMLVIIGVLNISNGLKELFP